MGRLGNYIMITIGIMIFLNLAGLTTTTGAILSKLGLSSVETVQNFDKTAFAVVILVAIGLLAGSSGIRIGTFGAPTTSLFASAVVALPLIALVADLISIINLGSPQIDGWVSKILLLIIAPVIVGYTLALYDWARGNDN